MWAETIELGTRANSMPPFKIVFVTGNANKLREVKAILAEGGAPIEITAQAVDGECSGAGTLCGERTVSFRLIWGWRWGWRLGLVG